MGKPLAILDLDFDRHNIKLRLSCNFGRIAGKSVKDVVEIDNNRILVLTYKPPEYFIIDVHFK